MKTVFTKKNWVDFDNVRNAEHVNTRDGVHGWVYDINREPRPHEIEVKSLGMGWRSANNYCVTGIKFA